MSGVVIVVAGYLASGKSTFARRLADAVNIPCFIKDTFKIALCKSVRVDDAADSSRFSAVTFDAMLYTAERLAERGCPLIIEGNFTPRGIKPVDEEGAIRDIIGRYGCRALTFKFTGDTRILHTRYVERDKTQERGAVNAMYGDTPFADFDRYCHNLDAFDTGGDIIDIDTTDFDTVDFDAHIETARRFMKHRM